jgi:tetratricopeptide (TPR) repeat protein
MNPYRVRFSLMLAAAFLYLAPLAAQNTDDASARLVPYRKGAMWGFADKKTLSPVITPEYALVRPFAGGLAAVRTGGAWGYIDATNRMVIAASFENAQSFAGNFAAVQSGGKWGFIDRSGKIIVSCRYEDARPFRFGRARVKVAGKWGVINTKGDKIIDFIYDEIGEFEGRVALAVRNGREVYISDTGHEFYDARYEQTVELKQHIDTGIGYFNKMDYRAALLSFNSAVSLDPNNAEAWIWKSRTHEMLKQDDDAQKAFDKARSLGWK